jgi:dGTPase
VRFEVNVLQSLMRRYVFDDPALAAQQYGQRQVLKTLIKIMLEAISASETKARAILPSPYLEFAKRLDAMSNEADRKRERARLAADIVASLTEQQALSLFGRLSGVSPGLVLDHIVR